MNLKGNLGERLYEDGGALAIQIVKKRTNLVKDETEKRPQVHEIAL